MILSNSNLEILRTRPQYTKLNLFIFQPSVVMKCQINSVSITKGARTIPYDSVSTGSYLSVEDGMTMLVGTQDGLEDVGRIRIRSVNGSQFTVSENSDIKWQDNLYITVLRFWEVWPIFPRIIQNPANEEDVLWYKDYDIPYSNQNYILGTFANAGCHQGVLIENGTGTVYYSSTGSYNLVGASLTYDWAFEGGNPTGSSSQDPGNVYYTVPGDYVTRLRITASNGAVDTTYRYISVKNKLGDGSQTPIKKWKIDNMSESRDEGAMSCEISVYDDISVQDHSVVIITSEDFYRGYKVSLGGNLPGSEHIFFVGYIEKGSIRYAYNRSYFTFSAISITGIMKKTTSFATSLESAVIATDWYEITDMNMKKAIYHYLRWHSTVLKISNFRFIGDDYPIQYFDSDRGSLFDAIDSAMRNTLLGTLCSDRQGNLWAEVHPQAYSNPTGTFSPVMEITKRDWRNEPSIDESFYPEYSYLEAGGVHYSGANTGTFSAYLSGAPGSSPTFKGLTDDIQGLALSGQSHLNQLSGNILANRNQRFPSISMEHAVAPRNLDIAPYEVVYIKINPSDTVREVTVDGLYVPNNIQWNYDSRNSILLADIDYRGIVSGNPGDTIIIPARASDSFDYDFSVDYGFDVSYDFPPLSSDDMILAIIDSIEINNAQILILDHGVFYTENLTDSSPTWKPMNLGLPNVTDMTKIEVSGSGKMFYQHGDQAIYYAEGPGSVWTKIFDASTDVGNPEGFPFPSNPTITAFGIDRNADDEIVIIAGLTATIFSDHVVYVWKGSHDSLTRTSSTYMVIVNAADSSGFLLKRTDGKWLFSYRADNTSTPTTAIVDAELGTLSNITTHLGNVESIVLTQSKYSYDTEIIKLGQTYLPKISTNAGVSFTNITGTLIPYTSALNDKYESIIATDDGEQIFLGRDNVYGIIYSNNYGVSWITGSYRGRVTAVWHLNNDSFLFAGSGSSVMFAYNFYPTEDNGYQMDKSGNLPNLITGTFNIMGIRHY